MWLARPIYELLPYVYMVLGLVLLGTAWVTEFETLPTVLTLAGAFSLTIGLVLWLRRRDYRTRQSEYSGRSLDD